MIGKKVVVTTDTTRRGVFFGTLADDQGDVVTLTDARNAIYWSAETRGFVGLSAIGPQPGSKIGPACPSLRLNGVTSIAECSEAAITAWEAGPWS